MPAILPQLHRACCWGIGPQRRCPSISDRIVCTQPPPVGSPLASPTTRYNPTPNRLDPQHTSSSPYCRRSQCTRSQQQLPPVSRSVLLRFSVVSCVILKRLGASDAAPAAPIRFAARTAAPRSTPRQNPHHTSYSPARTRPSPQHATSPHAQPAFATTRSQCSWQPMHAAYRRGPATSAAASLRDSVPATLPHHLRFH